MSTSNSTTTTTSANSHSNSRRSSSAGGGGTGSPGGAANPTQACAACKYQRRKCNPDCTLAPYFPADHQRQFLNAHRLFGVSNILKTIRGLDPIQRAAAMRNIIFQSNMRAQDPVGGCYRIVLDLQRQIEKANRDLEQIMRHLGHLRGQTLPSNQPFLQDQNAISSSISDDHHLQQQQYLYYYCGGGESSGIIKNQEPEIEQPPSSSPLRLRGRDNGQDLQQPENEDGDNDKLPMTTFELRHHEQMAFPEAVDQEEDQKGVSTLDFSSMARLDMVDESDTILDQVQDHELKSAASLLKLTNCNMSGM